MKSAIFWEMKAGFVISNLFSFKNLAFNISRLNLCEQYSLIGSAFIDKRLRNMKVLGENLIFTSKWSVKIRSK